MISIVIVSHSREIAQGLKRLADEMSAQPVPVFAAGGMDEEDNPLGTDAVLILGALQEALDADQSDGVLVFADLGSAKLNAETAIDLLEDDQKEKVRFCEAPLVEGVLAAVVASAAGGDIATVMNEAKASYVPVSEGEETPKDGDKASANEIPEDGDYREYKIANPLGLHARPAAKFVGAIGNLDADVRVRNVTTRSDFVNAKSINRLMMIEILSNHTIGVVATGNDAAKVHAAIADLVADNFGEGPLPKGAATTSAAKTEKVAEAKEAEATNTGPVLSGIGIASGYGAAPVAWVGTRLSDVDRQTIAQDDIGDEIARFEAALKTAGDEIRALLDQKSGQVDAYDARIFEAHLLYLKDPEIIQAVRDRIENDLVCAPYAWKETVDGLIAYYRKLQDTTLRARADDMADIGARVLRAFAGNTGQTAQHYAKSVILCFDDITPSAVMGLDLANVEGICAVAGGKTSHAAILAGSLGVPVVFGLGAALKQVENDQTILIDGQDGTVNIAPESNEVEKLQTAKKRWQDRKRAADEIRFEPAVTTDQVRARVAANIAGVAEAADVVESGAEEVGLFRTEFLFMNRLDAPDEDTQYDVYRQVLETLDGRPLTIRTMDIGGDKPVPYLDRPDEANPNLGWRGIRYSLDRDDLFETQLRAILRASVYGPTRIMFPLVSTVAELDQAKEALDRARAGLKKDGIEFSADVETGIMIEVPAAAEIAPALAQKVDFFSIGTNDLTQYVMAADRGNAKIKALFDPLQPAVIRMIDRAIRAAHGADIWIGMCGAMAGDGTALPLLLGLGLDEFSMSPSQVPAFKLDFRHVSKKDCEDLAQEVLKLDDLDAVKARLAEFRSTMMR